MRWDFVLVIVFIACTSSANGSDKASISTETYKEINEKLRLLNKPAVKSIKSEDGDIIDCVDIHKQPAFDHPSLKHHVIQMGPTYRFPYNIVRPENESSKPVMSQTWQKSGSCPDGTIPIRRIRRQDLQRAPSIRRFGMKNPHFSPPPSNASTVDHPQVNRTIVFNDTTYTLGYQVNRSEAMIVTLGYNYIGASADVNIWNPSIDSDHHGDYSSRQIWLLGGPGDNFNSVESGWIVNPSLYGDTRSRFFVHWTKDSYNSTGCFDLTCSGFIQTSKEVAVGAAFDAWSSQWQQYYIALGIYMDTNTSNWWLQCGPNQTVVGYWPAELFSYLRHSAILVQWGGEVYSGMVRKRPHTKTGMGSGDFAESLYGNAAFMNHLRIVDWSRYHKYPYWVGTYNAEPYCYDGFNYREGYIGEPMYFYGGPGRTTLCP